MLFSLLVSFFGGELPEGIWATTENRFFALSKSGGLFNEGSRFASLVYNRITPSGETWYGYSVGPAPMEGGLTDKGLPADTYEPRTLKMFLKYPPKAGSAPFESGSHVARSNNGSQGLLRFIPWKATDKKGGDMLLQSVVGSAGERSRFEWICDFDKLWAEGSYSDGSFTFKPVHETGNRIRGEFLYNGRRYIFSAPFGNVSGYAYLTHYQSGNDSGILYFQFAPEPGQVARLREKQYGPCERLLFYFYLTDGSTPNGIAKLISRAKGRSV